MFLLKKITKHQKQFGSAEALYFRLSLLKSQVFATGGKC